MKIANRILGVILLSAEIIPIWVLGYKYFHLFIIDTIGGRLLSFPGWFFNYVNINTLQELGFGMLIIMLVFITGWAILKPSRISMIVISIFLALVLMQDFFMYIVFFIGH